MLSHYYGTFSSLFCSVTGTVTSRKFWNKKPLKGSYYLIYWSQSLSQMHRATFRFVVVSFADRETYCKFPSLYFSKALEGLMYGGKFAFQNRLNWLAVGRKFTIFIPANLRRSKIWRPSILHYTPPPTPECQQHQHPHSPPPAPTNCLRTLYDVLHDVHGIKIRFHHCNDELIFVID